MREPMTGLGLACDRILIARWVWLGHGVDRSFDIGAASCGNDPPALFWPFLSVPRTLELRSSSAIDTTFSVRYSVLKV